MKRWLYLIHRWIGVATCLLFVMWFASGLVMLYVPFPSLSEAERVEGLSTIAWEQLGDRDAAMLAAPARDARQIVLEMRGNRPIWRINRWEAPPIAIWGGGAGATAGDVSRAEAERIAASFGKADVEQIRAIHTDQWVVTHRYDEHRPLWKAQLAGEGGRVLYVSSDGAVVLDTNAHERFWNWLGSVPHWLYPRALREDQPLWRQVVLWSSGPCILVALTGIWIGLMRLRAGKRRFKGGRMTPYGGWMKWHHLTGLIGSLFLILWIFSGWLSVDPGRLFASDGIGTDAQRDYAGREALTIPDWSRIAARVPDARRLVISAAAGRTIVRVQRADGQERLLDAATLAPLRVDDDAIFASAAKLVPHGRIIGTDRLTRPDAYWYAVKGEVPLPVLRIMFDDPAATWVHITPTSGAVIGVSDQKRRVYRWLFDLFHRWDLNLLIQAAPARDLLIWLMSLVGLVASASGVVIGWRRLRRRC
ncbi:MAG: hypothetical protein KKD64_07045 [Alphaproteobacteria bacterium]|nr:hypothetical protein [Alphaproteobacteria bacterium]MBU0794165.1 hypothetical protein [Alphaproteobacteria bacterium]MBU0876692.1 hypothetical protein [Alphaproteobacteria bacterium]MBU1769394.1 hypothetical protein [Alphaproteobacteria bacterium]